MIYSPGSAVADGTETSTASTETETPVVNPETPATPESPQAKELLAVINADREARERSARNEAEAASYKVKYTEAQAKLDEYNRAKDNALLDSAGYMRKLGYSDKEIATFAEGLMYSLVPDKAPPDFRAKAVEAQMLRDRKLSEEREAARPAQEAARRAQEQAEYSKNVEAQYATTLKGAAAAFQPGAYVASQAWFGKDHDKYAESLFNTAREMAETAQRAGTRADLSPQSVAKALETQMMERAKRFTSLGTPAQPERAAAPQNSSTEQPTAPPRGVSSDSRISKQTWTDADLIRKAVEAGFSARS